MVDDTRIRFGLAAIKNIGTQVVEAIIAERKTGGQFTGLENFIERTAGRELNKKSLESLIKSGALDSLQPERGQLLNGIDTILAFARSAREARVANQSSLFSEALGTNSLRLKLAKATPTTNQTKLAWERELLGLYVTAHPFSDYAQALKGIVVMLSELGGLSGEPTITTAGLISELKLITTKRGEAMLFASLEDTTGSTELVVFPETYRTYHDQLTLDSVVAVRGRLSHKDGERKIILEQLYLLPSPQLAAERLRAWLGQPSPALKMGIQNRSPEFIIRLPQQASASTLAELKKLLAHYPGQTSVILLVHQGAAWTKIRAPGGVTVSQELTHAIGELLGQAALE